MKRQYIWKDDPGVLDITICQKNPVNISFANEERFKKLTTRITEFWKSKLGYGQESVDVSLQSSIYDNNLIITWNNLIITCTIGNRTCKKDTHYIIGKYGRFLPYCLTFKGEFFLVTPYPYTKLSILLFSDPKKEFPLFINYDMLANNFFGFHVFFHRLNYAPIPTSQRISFQPDERSLIQLKYVIRKSITLSNDKIKDENCVFERHQERHYNQCLCLNPFWPIPKVLANYQICFNFSNKTNTEIENQFICSRKYKLYMNTTDVEFDCHTKSSHIIYEIEKIGLTKKLPCVPIMQQEINCSAIQRNKGENLNLNCSNNTGIVDFSSFHQCIHINTTIVLHIQPSEYPIVVIDEELSYDFDYLLTNLGGAIGLWVGIGMIGLIEVGNCVYAFILRLSDKVNIICFLYKNEKKIVPS